MRGRFLDLGAGHRCVILDSVVDIAWGEGAVEMWTVQEAKAKLSEVLERARAGEAQIIGARDPCVVVSMDEYDRLKSRQAEPHLGKWRVENLRGLCEVELPSRQGTAGSIRDWSDEDFGGEPIAGPCSTRTSCRRSCFDPTPVRESGFSSKRDGIDRLRRRFSVS